MSNPSIECQVAKLLRGAEAAMFANINDKIEITILAERLRADLKAIAGTSCHYVIDRGVDALQHAAVWDDVDSGRDAVLSIIRCVMNGEIERASGDFLSKAEETRRLIGLYRWQEYDVNTRPNDILSQLSFVDSDSPVYEYKSESMPSFKKTNE